jgi:hypothetical protein
MSLTWRRSRITGAGLVAAQYDLTLERQTTMDNILFIPGIANPVSEIRQLLFGQGQPGGSWIPTLSAAMIAANSFGSGVTDILDLSGRNNPFSQATPSSRGAWFREPKTGRRNLLTRSNEFNILPWALIAVGAGVNPIITPNAGADPLGGNQAFRIDFNRGGNAIADRSEVTQTISSVLTGQNVLSVWVKAATNDDIGKDIAIRHVGTGVYGVVTLTADWVRVSRVETAAGSANNISFGSRGGANTSTTVSALVYQMQLESGAIPTPIQNVTTAFDVTEAGQRDCYGVQGDGIDDGYSTAGNVDFSATDAVTIFAAMRKVGTTSATFCELSAQADTNNGAFYLRAPLSSTDSYDVLSRGTANARLVPTAFPSPITNILTAQFRISTDFANLRVDGNSVLSVSTDQGSGNYGNYPLFLMSRNNTTSRFNGRLYALIVAGGSYPLSTIQRVERLLSRITPTVNL